MPQTFHEKNIVAKVRLQVIGRFSGEGN